MKISQLLACPPQMGDIGLEIEMEGENIPHKDLTPHSWRKEVDASLRGESAEYVLRKPLSLDNTMRALEDLQAMFDLCGTTFTPTYRAGIHVHVNVQDLTPVQLVTFICSYFMLEEVLLRFCDKSRLGNHFCLRMSDASYSLDRLVEFVERQDIHTLNSEDLRYASLNVTSLFKYGSVEFRALESTLDPERIRIWAGVLVHLRDYAKTISSPVDLLGQASVLGFTEYAPVILGPYYQHFRAWATEANIRQGIRNIQYAIYARDWSSKNHNIFTQNNLFDAP